VTGELVAVDRGEVFVQPDRSEIVMVPIDQVQHARMIEKGTAVPAWMGLTGGAPVRGGGIHLNYTAPILIPSTPVVVVEKMSLINFPDRTVDEMRAYSRYPDGLPADALVAPTPPPPVPAKPVEPEKPASPPPPAPPDPDKSGFEP
jgi:hypothetical protein